MPNTIIKAKLLECDRPTARTGRTYPKDVMKEAVEKYQETVRTGRAYGELNNPDSPQLSLSNVSHRVVDLHFENDNLMVSFEILDTPAGNQLKKLIERGVDESILRVTPVCTGKINDTGVLSDVEIHKTNFIYVEENDATAKQ